MRRIAISFALLAVLLQIHSPALAQTSESGGRRIVTTTRLVAQFSDLEQKLTEAVQHKDKAALNRFLSDDFEVWTPAPPGDPIPREEWLQNVLNGFILQSFQLRQMAVRMAGETAVVSFVQHRVCKGQDCSGDRFIVDLWQQHNGAQQLIVRYESPAQALGQQVPPSPPRPTGKE